MTITATLDSLQFQFNGWGQLVLVLPDGTLHEGVDLVRCFPWTDPERHIAVLDAAGHELLLVYRLDQLNDAAAAVVRQALAEREFVPQIQEVLATSSPALPSRWTVQTDRGRAEFQIDSEDDLRRLSADRILICDTNGVKYLIPDLQALGPASRRILRRYF